MTGIPALAAGISVCEFHKLQVRSGAFFLKSGFKTRQSIDVIGAGFMGRTTVIRMIDGLPVVMVVTALDVEHRAMNAHLTDMRAEKHPKGTIFDIGSVHGTSFRIALVATGDGNLKAGVLTERAITAYNPLAVLFVGIAGALTDDIALGDVVVALRTYGYHGGREGRNGFQARPRSWETAHELEQLARHVERTRSWNRFLDERIRDRPPAVHFRSIAAGEIVLDARDSQSAERIASYYNDAAAIEMESAGVAQAAHLNLRVPMITIRGISDSASGSKEITDRSGWREIAARNAAAFALGLIHEMDIAPQRGPSSRPSTGTPARPVSSAPAAEAGTGPAADRAVGKKGIRLRPYLANRRIIVGCVTTLAATAAMIALGNPFAGNGGHPELVNHRTQHGSTATATPTTGRSHPATPSPATSPPLPVTQPVITLSPDHGINEDWFTIYGRGWYDTAPCGGQVNIWIDDYILSPYPGSPSSNGRFITTYPGEANRPLKTGVHEVTARCHNYESPAVKYTVDP